MANSTRSKRAAKVKKPRPDFPLFPHATGRWAKKVRGKFCFFGKVADDPKGEAAARKWAEQKDDLLAGRTPRANRDGLTVSELCNRFLTAKERQRDAGDLAPSTFADYLRTCKQLTAAFGRDRFVDDLAAEDFETLRATLAKQYGVHRLGNTVKRVRSIFKYGYDAGLIDKPVRFGPTFKQPSARNRRLHRQRNGQRMFEAAEIRQLLDAADQPLKAMILLGINCGFGNSDCATLPKSALDLERGWVDYPRPKTAVERRCPLWPETVKALRQAISTRPVAKNPKHSGLAFITKYGRPWASEPKVVVAHGENGEEINKIVGENSPVSKEFRKLMVAVDEAAAKKAKKRRVKAPAKLQRRGVGFYAMRHTFETVGGESRDQVAVDHIMGHADASMAAHYRERISDDRLVAVANVVRRWLFVQKKQIG
jgi:integrase